MPKSRGKTKRRGDKGETPIDELSNSTSKLILTRTQYERPTTAMEAGTSIRGSAMSDVAAMPADPMTMVGGNQTPATPEKKKKKKKTKVSSVEKAKAKLEKEADELRKSGQKFTDFVNRMDIWLKNNAKPAIDLFRKFDADGEGVLTFEEIKPGLKDLQIPCNAVELHLFCQTFDKFDNEEIDYLDLSKGMAFARQQEEAYTAEDIRPSIILTNRTLNRCPCCKLARWDGEPYRQAFPRFIQVTMNLVTFDSFKSHPAHLTELVHSHLTVAGVCQLLVDRTEIVTSQMVVFTDKSREVKYMLMPHKTLEECGFPGGTQDNPEVLTLYYDYKVDFKDCPLLLCDHYFGQKVKT